MVVKDWSRSFQFCLVWILVSMVVCSGLFIACGDDDDDDDSAGTEYDSYLPLYEGNRWDFAVTSTEESGTGSAQVLGMSAFNGQQSLPVQFMETSGQGLGTGNVYLHANTAVVDVYGAVYDSANYILDMPFTIIQFPLSVGKSWSSTSSMTIEGIPATLSAQTTVDSMENVTVGGTEYTGCFKLSTTVSITVTVIFPIQFDIPIQSWLAPNIGPVQLVATIPVIALLPDLPSGDVWVELTGTNF